MATVTKCPTCRGFGSPKLDGYCKNCYPYNEDEPQPFNREVTLGKPFFREKPWFPETFGCLDKKNLNKEPTL